MAVTLTMSLELAGVKSVLSFYRQAGEDLTPLMEMCGALLETSTKDRLRETNTAPDGAAWPKSFRAELDGGKTLHDSGRLANSIQYLAGPAQVEVGTNVIYAGIHQTGGTIVPKAGGALAFGLPNGEFAVVGSVTLPARPYLGISDLDRDDIEAAAVQYLDAAVPR
ncbi:phage virion morphogenesis protein [Sulfitobacter alexandrii]|uniref:phage virion morphogenesis protein n=1 Tax=Sulfitobacter alexandrii TaxID=1917485 RepID=UPI0009FB21E6|nr:phage virion morphogenesis protein [Sulfitobacter alexandrii]